MEVTARAPGKIILSGEHAVVHGYTAVASSIDLYTVVSLRLRSGSFLFLFFHSFNCYVFFLNGDFRVEFYEIKDILSWVILRLCKMFR